MGMFLNSRVPYEGYREVLRDPYFVDKTPILKELVPYFGKRNRYCCITRPRRFGKTVMANMVGAFFGKTDEGDRIFEDLAISGEKEYSAHLNQHDLIYIDFGRGIKGCQSFAQYIERIEKGILEDLAAAYPDYDLGEIVSVWDVLQKIFDEVELSAVVNLCYLSARNKYRVEREDRAGKGYVDFIFYPERKNADGIILELKVDSTPKEAIEQIKDKRYNLRFQGKLGERPKFPGRILAVGISYSRETKEHWCEVEVLQGTGV